MDNVLDFQAYFLYEYESYEMEYNSSLEQVNVSYEDLMNLFQYEGNFIPKEFDRNLKVTLALFYIFISIGAIVGNICVLAVILFTPKLRTVTNTFIVSLATSDTLIASWNVPLQLAYYFRNAWTLGPGMCKATSYVQGTSVMASILTLTAISLERYSWKSQMISGLTP